MTRLASALATGSEAAVAALGRISSPLAQGRVLEQRSHRPWPTPAGPWFMAQTWDELLFAHWPVSPERLDGLLPPEIPLDTFNGRAWIGVTPFRVGAFRLRGVVHLPGVASFNEVNVRTYATVDGKPGIFFLSLDADSRFAVAGARRTYRLPYFRARIDVRRGEWIDYRAERTSSDGPAARLALRYGPTGPARPAEPGTLDYFLTERYCLYTIDERGVPHRADIHHPPWPLQPAEAEIEANTMAAPWGFDLDEAKPLLHFSRRQDVVIWRLDPLA